MIRLMRHRILRAVAILGLASSLTICLKAHHNGTRYFPLLEKTEDITTKKRSSLTPEFFYFMASTAHKHGGGNGGIPDLWGKYDLKDVMASLRAVQGDVAADQVKNILSQGLQDKSLKFKVNGKIQAQGFALGHEHALKWNGLSIGLWAPVMHISSTSQFDLDLNGQGGIDGYGNPLASVIDGDFILNSEGLKVDKARRAVHDKLGFSGNHWEATGLGDVDMHIRWNYFIDHQCLMRSIDNYIQAGVIIPTGMKIKVNEPLSLPTMGNGHWGAYLDILPEFELKQDWKFGFLLGGLYQFKETRNIRLPVGNEPAPYSALTGKIETQPGFTAKLSPYFTLENLTDGVNFQIRYTYLRHGTDKFYDRRADKTIASYLGKPDISGAPSKWRAHFFSFHVTYDAKQALQKMAMDPLIYVTYDLPISGNGIAKTHQVSVGAKLHF